MDLSLGGCCLEAFKMSSLCKKSGISLMSTSTDQTICVLLLNLTTCQPFSCWGVYYSEKKTAWFVANFGQLGRPTVLGPT